MKDLLFDTIVISFTIFIKLIIEFISLFDCNW